MKVTYSPMERSADRTRWAWAVAGLALALLALSLIPEWLVHHRELRGEGYRSLVVGLTAWQLRSGSLPVLGGAVALAAAVGALVVARPSWRPWASVGAAAVLGLLLAGLVPVSTVGHISRLWIGPGWALVVAIVLAAGIAVLVLRGTRPSRSIAVAALAALLVSAGMGTGTRMLQLELVEGATPNWSDGTWHRADGASGELVLDEGTFALDGWSGQMEPAGINVILTDDAGCPDARGFYRVRTVDDGVLWERVIDTCADGARAEALEGIWRQADG
jgi:hypothetical protein